MERFYGMTFWNGSRRMVLWSEMILGTEEWNGKNKLILTGRAEFSRVIRRKGRANN